MRDHHFICFRNLPLLYGRVPKVANSSIKAALARLLDLPSTKGVRTTADSFWMDGTEGQTSMVNNTTARLCRGTHFCFSFVRNPFDRLVSAYNNKILELDEPPGPMQAMGLTHAMPFAAFMECVVMTPDAQLDVHLLPQSSILCLDGQLIPNFVGRLEQMDRDWDKLGVACVRKDCPALNNSPKKTGDAATTTMMWAATSRIQDLFSWFVTVSAMSWSGSTAMSIKMNSASADSAS